MNLAQPQIISIAVNAGIFLVLTIASFILVSKIKLDEKGYKYLFWMYTMYWVPTMLVRPYRGTMQQAIDGTLLLVTIVTMVYGLVGIFVRIFADVINYLFKYRKAFLYFSVVSQVVLFIPIVISPTTASNIASAIGIGIGASCIGTYELLFKEQYGDKKAFLTVSVLSIPPLLANFLTAPIQSIIKTLATDNKVVDPNILKYMWVISLVFSLLVFILLIFYKEKRMEIPLVNKPKITDAKLYNQQKLYDYTMFIGLALIGSLVTFIKFSNSDALATQHLHNLSELNYGTTEAVASYEGYISVVFSLFQLVSGVLMGLVLVKKIKVVSIFWIGSGSWIIYLIGSSFISNPIGYFIIHSLNGFGYGILYNLVLAIVLKISIDNKIVTKMGIYQSILSAGIMFSSWFTTWMKTIIVDKVDGQLISMEQYMQNYLIQNMVLLAIVVLMGIAFMLLMMFFDKKVDSSRLNNKKIDDKKLESPSIEKTPNLVPTTFTGHRYVI